MGWVWLLWSSIHPSPYERIEAWWPQSNVNQIKTWDLGPLRSDGFFLLYLAREPLKRLGSELEAKTWLDRITALYAQSAGISLSSGAGAAGGSGGAGGGPVVNGEDCIKFQVAQHEFASYKSNSTRAIDVEKGNDARTSGEAKHQQGRREYLH